MSNENYFEMCKVVNESTALPFNIDAGMERQLKNLLMKTKQNLQRKKSTDVDRLAPKLVAVTKRLTPDKIISMLGSE